MVNRIPDQRLVYLHCASVFKGDRAQIRKHKKVTEVLSKHSHSIKTLTNEFSLDAIATVAKALLDQKIFESEARAKLHFPELFQPSETQEAEREASEARVARIEAETVQETIVTSDEEWEEEILNNKISQGQLSPSIAEPLLIVGEAGHSDVPQTTQRQGDDPIPRLYPIYLPFRAQHQVLTLVQSTLEECCFDFGNSWIPELMKENNWEEAESIELTQWIKRVSKHAESLPQMATKVPSGKGLKEVLFATSTLRHSAVHRLRTSAAGILKMLDGALAFTEALNDIEKATQIEKIKNEFRVIIDEIVQYQTLLACKLSGQLKDLARRRAEIDELERQAIEDMLNSDKIYRTLAGSMVEDFLTDLTKAPQVHMPEEESKDEYQNKSSRPAEYMNSDDEGLDANSGGGGPNEANAATDPDLLDESQSKQEWKVEQNSNLVAPLPVNDGNEVSLLDVDTDGTFVDIPSFSATNERSREMKCKDRCRASRNVDEVPQPSVFCPTAEDPLIDDYNPAEYNAAEGSVGSGVGIENPQADDVVVVADALEADYAAADHEIPSVPSLTGNDAEILETSTDVDDGYSLVHAAEEPHLPHAPVEQVEAGLERSSSVSRPPSPRGLIKESTVKLEGPKEYAIVLKIPHGSETLMTMVCLSSATKTAILDEAEAIYAEHVLQDEPVGKGWRRRFIMGPLTVTIDGHEVDTSTFASEDLTFLVERISKSTIPMFTVEIP